MIRLTILWILTIMGCIAEAQVTTLTDIEFNNSKYDIFKVTLDTSTVKKFSILENAKLIQHKDLATTKIPDTSLFFLINAGIVDSTCKPLGLLINNGMEMNPLNLSDGIGNFYLKPNGVLAFDDHTAYIIESDSSLSIKNITLAVQSGPMLVNDGIYNPQFNAGSVNKHYRCGVGFTRTSSGYDQLVFSISKQPVNFYEFASFFKEYMNCNNALCLESAGITMKLPFFSNFTDNSTIVVCRYLMYSL